MEEGREVWRRGDKDGGGIRRIEKEGEDLRRGEKDGEGRRRMEEGGWESRREKEGEGRRRTEDGVCSSKSGGCCYLLSYQADTGCAITLNYMRIIALALKTHFKCSNLLKQI